MPSRSDMCHVSPSGCVCGMRGCGLGEQGYLVWATHSGGDIPHEPTFIQPQPFIIPVPILTPTLTCPTNTTFTLQHVME